MRYYSFSSYCKKVFGKKLYRVALDAGCTCPNRDGKIDNRGCIFCSKHGSGDFSISFKGQILKKEDFIYNHIEAEEGEYIAYFQSYSNTYGDINYLKSLYTAALDNPLFRGIDIATRPDCIDEEVIEVVKALKNKYPNKFIWIELGLQTINPISAKWMRRGYELDVFTKAVKSLNEIGIDVIAHIILGLPHDTKEDVLACIDYLNNLDIEGVKIHLLHYLKDTDLGEEYLNNNDKYHPLTEDEYVDLVVSCIGRLKENVVIHRLTGDGNKEDLIAPLWSCDKKHVLNRINHELKERNITQGCDL